MYFDSVRLENFSILEREIREQSAIASESDDQALASAASEREHRGRALLLVALLDACALLVLDVSSEHDLVRELYTALDSEREQRAAMLTASHVAYLLARAASI